MYIKKKVTVLLDFEQSWTKGKYAEGEDSLGGLFLGEEKIRQ